MLAISPQQPAANAAVREKLKLDYPILADPGNAFARQLGVVYRVPADLQQLYLGFGIDVPAANGDDSWELPLASRLVVGGDGVIASMDAGLDYTVRPEPDASVDVVKGLA